MRITIRDFRRKVAARLEPISTDGGDSPRWRRDGKELYYIGRDNTLMAVAIRAGESGIEVGGTQPRFRTSFRASTLPYAVSADGRFLVNRAIADPLPRSITLVVNWPTLLKP